MESVDQLAKKAAGLQPIERIRLIEAILYSLDKPDSDIEQSWIAESEARYEAYTRGELEAIDWDEIIITALAHLHRKPDHYKDRIM
jgi:putative addiction module component (TIGR02574 family)